MEAAAKENCFAKDALSMRGGQSHDTVYTNITQGAARHFWRRLDVSTDICDQISKGTKQCWLRLRIDQIIFIDLNIFEIVQSVRKNTSDNVGIMRIRFIVANMLCQRLGLMVHTLRFEAVEVYPKFFQGVWSMVQQMKFYFGHTNTINL